MTNAGVDRNKEIFDFIGKAERKILRDPEVRGTLRRSLRTEPSDNMGAYMAVIPLIPEDWGPDYQRVACLVAAFIAAHPKSGIDITGFGNSSLGAALAACSGANAPMAQATADRRLLALTRRDFDALLSSGELATVVSTITRMKPQSNLSWSRLTRDLMDWKYNQHRVSRSWIKDMYTYRKDDLSVEAESPA